MHIDLIRSGSKSLPHQISETLSQRISSGLLQQGVRLPSVRSLATAESKPGYSKQGIRCA